MTPVDSTSPTSPPSLSPYHLSPNDGNSAPPCPRSRSCSLASIGHVSLSGVVVTSHGASRQRRFSVKVIEASLCVFLSLCVSLAGLFLGLLYEPLLLVVFACGLVALVAYLCYALVLYKRSWRRRSSGSMPPFWAGQRKISVVSVDKMPTINEATIEDDVSLSRSTEETWSGKTYVVQQNLSS
ncbi:unnamed protein product [Ixodes pacificus]